MTTAQQDANTAPPRDLSSAEKQQAALRYARQYVASHGKRGAGAAVAREFDMSPRWGQDIAAAVAESAAAPASAVPIGRTGTADRRTVADAVAARSGSAGPARAVFGSAESAVGSAVPSAPPAAPPARTGTPIGSGSAARSAPATTGPSARPAVGSAAHRQPTGTADQQSGGSAHPASIWVRAVTIVSVSVVAVVAAVVSYVHMHELAEKSGEGWRSILVPLSVDGLLVAASMVMLVRRQRGEPAGLLPWVGVALGLIASLGANVLSVGDIAWANLVPIIVSAWPPVALALSVEFLLIVTGGRHRKAVA